MTKFRVKKPIIDMVEGEDGEEDGQNSRDRKKKLVQFE